MSLVQVAAVVLAAGKGTRMGATDTNKVAQILGQKPLITHTVSHLVSAGFGQIVVVVGFAANSVKKVLVGKPVTYAYQPERLGTADALNLGVEKVKSSYRTIISLYGDDSAFYPKSLYPKLIAYHRQNQASITLLTVNVINPIGLGRIIRDSQGNLVQIIEDKNATPDQKKIHEINTGLFCFDRTVLTDLLPKIHQNSVSGEYYLTEIVELACKNSFKVVGFSWPDSDIWHGVNTPEELFKARQKILNLP
jgi:bifunctional N-acetylglucosamine-1-phosphate-uridyltransferase/glucosamine-1-phosphate-acetyltransferase GlmU-like protein